MSAIFMPYVLSNRNDLYSPHVPSNNGSSSQTGSRVISIAREHHTPGQSPPRLSILVHSISLFPVIILSTFPKGLFQNLSTIRIFNPMALSLPLVSDLHSYFTEKIKIHELIAVLIPEPLNLSILT